MILNMEKIRIAAARKCYTMTETFKEAHMSVVTVKRIKDGKEINTKTAGKLAAALGVDIVELLASD